MKITRKMIKEEKAAVVLVEGAIIFPIVFFCIAFLLFLGNALHEKAKLDAIVMKAATEGAQYIADPYNNALIHTGAASNEKNFPDNLKDLENSDGTKPTTRPYRYLIGFDDVEKEVRESVKEQIQDSGSRFFKFKLHKDPTVKAEFHNNVFNMTFEVKAEFNYKLPFSFGGMSVPPIVTISSKEEVAVNDCDEFIRNTDVAIDMVKFVADKTKIGQSITEKLSKIKDFFDKFTKND